MKNKPLLCLIPACSLLFAACSANAHEIYGKAGFLGAGIGYSYGINEYFNVRADYSTIGTYERTQTVDQLKVKGKLKADQLGLYGDWFPFAGTFRVTAGVHQRKLELSADGRASNGFWTINDTRIEADPNDSANGKVKFKKVAPYLGIGWGHQSTEPGFGFIADLGVSFGNASSEFDVSDSVRDKLELAHQFQGAADPAAAAAADIEHQRKKLKDAIAGIKYVPQAYIGISYNF